MNFKFLILTFFVLTIQTKSQSSCNVKVQVAQKEIILERKNGGVKIPLKFVKDSGCGDSLNIGNIPVFIGGSNIVSDTSAENWTKLIQSIPQFLVFDNKNKVFLPESSFASYTNLNDEIEATSMILQLDTQNLKLKSIDTRKDKKNLYPERKFILRNEVNTSIYAVLRDKYKLSKGEYKLVLVFPIDIIISDRLLSVNGSHQSDRRVILTNSVKLLVK